MAYGSGLLGQFGWAAETTAGTPVTVTKFAEVTDAKRKAIKTRKIVEGFRAGGAVPLASKAVFTTVGAEGSFEVPFHYRTIGSLVKWALGANTGAPGTFQTTGYEQLHVPGDGSHAGNSLTVQYGIPNTAGTVNPYTYNGVKCKSFEFSGTIDDYLMFKAEWDGWNEATATALATASYATASNLVTGPQMVVKLGGTATTSTGKTSVAGGTNLDGVKGFTFTGDNALNTERYYANSSGVKSEQLVAGYREWNVELDMDYILRTTLYDAWAANTTQVLQIIYTGAQIGAGPATDLIEFTFPAWKLDEPEIDLDGQSVVPQKIKGRLLDDGSGTNPFCQVRIVSADSTL